MHRANHDNEPAIEAFNRYLELTRGKDAAQDKRVEEQIVELGGTVTRDDKKGPKGPKQKQKQKQKTRPKPKPAN